MNNLYIWSSYPIDIDLCLYQELFNKLTMNVTIVYFNKIANDRGKCGYAESTESVITRKVSDIEEAKSILDESISQLHFFFGMLHENEILINYLISVNKNIKIGIISERYNPFGNTIIRRLKYMIRKDKFKRCALKWENNIGMILAYGEMGVLYFEKCGFNRDILFPFIYCTNNKQVYKTIDIGSSLRTQQSDVKVRFFYIGRLSFGLKGVDVLMHAFERINCSDWVLDIAGGYGDNVDEIVEWAKKNRQVNYIGMIKKDDVIKRMRNYDVCIVPSRREGYNTIPAQCIAAHIGCIVSDESVSSELVKQANSGLITKSGSVSDLSSAILQTIHDKNLIPLWKNNAALFEDCIELDTISDYVTKVIRFEFLGESDEYPKCPWF